MANARKRLPSTDKAADKKPTKKAHQLASVPDKKIVDEYVSRTIDGVEDYEIFEYAHENNMNVLIEGPTGPGKTTAVMAYAAKNDHAFYAVPSNVGVEPSQLFGKFIPDGEGGFVWQDGPVTDLVRHGGVLLINEVNFIPPRVATVMFGLLDRRREITLLDHKSEVVKAHEDLLVVADMNPDYSGTQQLNQAFRNRFGIQLHWGYDNEVEAQLVKSEHMLKVANLIRQEVADGTLFTPVSTNMLQEFERVAQFNFDFAVTNFVTHFLPDERPAVKVIISTFEENIKEDLFGPPIVIVVTDADGKEWTQEMLDELRADNMDNPDYQDPQYGKYGVDFEWGNEDEDEEEDEDW